MSNSATKTYFGLVIFVASTFEATSDQHSIHRPIDPSEIAAKQVLLDDAASMAAEARRTGSRAGDVVNAADDPYRAKCDGTNDDAPAINSALAAIRDGYNTNHFPIGHIARFTLPRGRCLIKTTINMTGLYGAGFAADLWGTLLLCRTSGAPCVDATGTGQSSILGLNIYADGIAPPNIGLVIGRTTNNGVGADHLYFEHPTITGTYTLTPYFNRQSETTTIVGGWFTNFGANAYGMVLDGSNHFNIQSAFTNKNYPADKTMSNNENTCIGCQIGTYGPNSVPLWIGGTARYTFTNGYIFYFYNKTADAPQPAIQVYSDLDRKVNNDFLDLDVHIEGKNNLTSAIQFIGPSSNPVIHSLSVRDNYPMQNGPFFSRGDGVRTVTIQDADIKLGILSGKNASWWDLAGAYTVGGRIYSQDGSYKAPNAFTGSACSGAICVNVSGRQ